MIDLALTHRCHALITLVLAWQALSVAMVTAVAETGEWIRCIIGRIAS